MAKMSKKAQAEYDRQMASYRLMGELRREIIRRRPGTDPKYALRVAKRFVQNGWGK